MDKELREEIRAVLQREVVLATGCTEPGAVALCVARAVELLGCEPKEISLKLSKNVFKNAMGVGIPGTGMIGLPIAVAMAVTNGCSSRGLEVLTMPENKVDEAKRWLEQNSSKITIGVKEGVDKLYIECRAGGEDGHYANAIIARWHTNFIYLAKDGEAILDKCCASSANDSGCENKAAMLSAQVVYDYATTTPIDELSFLYDTVRINTVASDCGLSGKGLHTGEILMKQAGGDIVHTVVARTVAASDARMEGCSCPVYSNSGSGNQGITCTLPPYYFGTLSGCDEAKILRALTMSHLMSIYIKQGIGRLSAMCGIINASIGVASAITYLKGGSFQQVCFAVKNMINTLAGMLCDGAKPSCALKMSAGLYSAFTASELAINNRVVDATDGLSECDIDCSINNLCRIGHDGMNDTDDMILDIMTSKHF